MMIEVEPLAIERFLRKTQSKRILALFFEVEALDNPDIKLITGLEASRISEAINDIASLSLLRPVATKKEKFTSNQKSCYSLTKFPNNLELAKSLIATTILQDEFKADKAKIELLLSEKKLSFVFK